MMLPLDKRKGKDFFKLFDKMKVLTESKIEVIKDKSIARIEYDLTEDAILGHRDFPGVGKACPSFDVRKWRKSGNVELY